MIKFIVLMLYPPPIDIELFISTVLDKFAVGNLIKNKSNETLKEHCSKLWPHSTPLLPKLAIETRRVISWGDPFKNQFYFHKGTFPPHYDVSRVFTHNTYPIRDSLKNKGKTCNNIRENLSLKI